MRKLVSVDVLQALPNHRNTLCVQDLRAVSKQPEHSTLLLTRVLRSVGAMVHSTLRWPNGPQGNDKTQLGSPQDAATPIDNPSRVGAPQKPAAPVPVNPL